MVQDVNLPDPESDLSISGGEHLRNTYRTIPPFDQASAVLCRTPFDARHAVPSLIEPY
jgi:hypothetical protein